MRHSSLFILSALMLSACGSKSSDTPQSKEEVAGEIAKAQTLKPGQYEMTMNINKLEVPGLPASALAQMKERMGPPQKVGYCLTPEKAKDGVKEMLNAMNGNCTFNNFKVEGGNVSGAMACKSPTGGEMKSTMVGTASADATNMKMDVVVSMPGQPVAMKMQTVMATRRTGECAATPPAPPKAG